MTGSEGRVVGQPTERHRVTSLELFFDLVFVFAFTQVSGLIAADPTPTGLLHGGLVLSVLWWAWSGYAWLTNLVDAEEGVVRLLVFASMGALLVLSLAVPGAFGRNALAFGVAYLVVRALDTTLFAIAGRGDHDVADAVRRLLPSALAAPVLIVAAALAGGTAQLVLWALALAVLYLAPFLRGIGRLRVVPAHFAERFGLIVIIALGESIVAIGVGAGGLPLDAGVIIAALLGITVAACLWWSYFDWLTYAGQALLTQLSGEARSALARDVYSYLHLPMVAGIVLFAFGLKVTLTDVERPLPDIASVGLVGGIALYFAAHVALRFRTRRELGRGRPVATLALLAFLPIAGRVPALVTLGYVAIVCVCLIAYEVVAHRESRAFIRQRRGEFSDEEMAQVVAVERRARQRRQRRERTT